MSPCRPVDSRLRGNDGVVGLSCNHPLLPVSGTGTGFDPLSSRERGIMVGLSCCHLTLHLWIADQVRNDGVSCLVCRYCLKASITVPGTTHPPRGFLE